MACFHTFALAKHKHSDVRTLVSSICCGLIGTMLMTSCSDSAKERSANKYPETRKVDTVDVYFGEKVSDPYRWLEDDRSAETAEWVKNQNKVTFAYLNNIPYRDKIKERLEKLYDYERLSAPFREGDYYYYYKNDGLQNHSVLYRKKSLDPVKYSWIQTRSRKTELQVWQVSRLRKTGPWQRTLSRKEGRTGERLLSSRLMTSLSWKTRCAISSSAESPGKAMKDFTTAATTSRRVVNCQHKPNTTNYFSTSWALPRRKTS